MAGGNTEKEGAAKLVSTSTNAEQFAVKVPTESSSLLHTAKAPAIGAGSGLSAASTFWVVSILGSLQGLQPILTKLSMNKGSYAYSPFSLNLCIDLAKIVLCMMPLLYQHGAKGLWQDLAHSQRRAWIMCCKYFIPAALFTAGNNMAFLCLKYIDAQSFNVWARVKVFVTAMCFSYIMQKPLTRQQWASVCLVLMGSVLSKIDVAFAQRSFQSFLQSDDFTGAMLVLGLQFLPSLGTVSNEYFFKQEPKQSIFLQNIQLYSWGALMNLLSWLTWNHGTGAHFFQGYDWRVLLCGSCFVLGGIGVSLAAACLLPASLGTMRGISFIAHNPFSLHPGRAIVFSNTHVHPYLKCHASAQVSFCLKYLDSMAYAYISSAAMFLSAFLAIPILGEHISLLFVVGMIIVTLGVSVHYNVVDFRKILAMLMAPIATSYAAANQDGYSRNTLPS